MIKLIHQIWIGEDPLPERFYKNSLGIEKINLEYSIIRWDNARAIKEYPEIIKWFDLGCVPAYISDWLRYRVISDYGGWYIDYDYTGILPLKTISNSDIFTVVKFSRPGFKFINGFFYADKGYPFGKLLNCIPDQVIMQDWNDFISAKDPTEYKIINSELISENGIAYREERVRSFYKHPKYNYRVIDNEWIHRHNLKGKE